MNIDGPVDMVERLTRTKLWTQAVVYSVWWIGVFTFLTTLVVRCT